MKIIYWLPRILAIVFIGLISLLAFDVFEGTSPIGEKLLGFVIHLIPTYILIAALILAWKKQVIGGIVFILLGLTYLIFARNQHWSAYLMITGFSTTIGILFMASRIMLKKPSKLTFG
jgi:hypothetical protein